MTTDKHARTEAPTQKRRDEARKKGDVAVSRDLTAGFGLMAAIGTLMMIGSSTAKSLGTMVRREILFSANRDLNPVEIAALARSSIGYLVSIIGAIVAAVIATHVLVIVLQTGWKITMTPLTPDWNRINPVKGWSRLFSASSAMRGLQGVIKMTLLIAIFLMTARSQMIDIASVPLDALPSVVALAWQIILRGGGSVAIALVVAGIFDYGFQWWNHENQMKMSLQEIKDERKQDEGDPHVKARIKRVQRELSQQRMLRDVATADVVLTNPTHYAVALKYDSNTMIAPLVVAKGADEVAKRIRELAAEHDVPVLERAPLTRALFQTVEVGNEIPPDLYQAIAEIVAYLYRVGRFR